MDQADKLNNIFYGSSRAHGSFLPDNITNGQKTQGKAKTIKTVGAETSHWQEHLEGKLGLGIIPIDEENEVKWGAIDVDQYSLDLNKLVKKIKLRIDKIDIIKKVDSVGIEVQKSKI